MSRELLQQALDALETKYSDYIYDGAGSAIAGAFEDDVAALRAALAQPAPAVQVVLRQPNLFAADPAAPAVNCEWTNCPHRVGDVCCKNRIIAAPPPINNRFVTPGCEQFGTRTNAERLLEMLSVALDECRRLAKQPVTEQIKPLTDELISDIAEHMGASDQNDSFWREFARAIESAHGIRA